jgi:prophage regulatory protein
MITSLDPSIDRLLRIAEVKSRVGLGKTKIYALIGEGTFPKPHKVTSSASRWSEREIDAWVAGIKQRGTPGG